MPRNGSGTYSLPQSPFVAGTVISSAAVNSDLSDIATALTASLPRDGQAGMTGQFKAIDGSTVAPSISFTNEPSSGFYHESAGVIGVVVSGIQVATINSGGIVGAVGSIPVGMVGDFAGATIPALWYLCFGQAVSRTTYVTLFGVIGTTYGSGDGTTTFNLPDHRGVVLVGRDDMGGTSSTRLTTTYYGNDPTVQGQYGGIQDIALSTGNLPPYTPVGSVGTSISSSLTSVPLIVFSNGGTNTPSGGANQAINGGIAATFSASSAFAGSAQGGTSAPHTLVQPSQITNKIIYAGA